MADKPDVERAGKLIQTAKDCGYLGRHLSFSRLEQAIAAEFAAIRREAERAAFEKADAIFAEIETWQLNWLNFRGLHAPDKLREILQRGRALADSTVSGGAPPKGFCTACGKVHEPTLKACLEASGLAGDAAKRDDEQQPGNRGIYNDGMK